MSGNFSIIEQWQKHSPPVIKHRESQLDPSLNVKTELFFDKIILHEHNIVEVVMRFKITYFPSNYFEIMQLVSECSYVIKDEQEEIKNDIFSDQSLDIFADLYESAMPNCYKELKQDIADKFKLNIKFSDEVNRMQSIGSIYAALRSFFKQSK